ncbi:MAG: 50S ribosomal protein L25/general stress protein Ctc [Gemmatimonadota bacterium]|nr:50S ribosomal protein L25/general stress protein Ctc [Gemmatimonadota bacterium]
MADNNGVSLQAEVRTGTGKGEAKRIRRTGRIPAVVYGDRSASVACSVDARELATVLHEHGRNTLLSLVVDNGEGRSEDTAIVKDLQHHPVGGHLLHADFYRISLTRTIVVEVRVESVGIPAGVRAEGGILEQLLHEVEVSCLPADIPDSIGFDVTNLNIGDSVHVSDLSVTGNVEIVTEGDRSLFVVVPPSVSQAEEEEEEVLEEEEEMQEPEVIERGKRDEEEVEE